MAIRHTKESLTDRLNAERQLWLGHKAVAERSGGMDGAAVRAQEDSVKFMDKLLDRWLVLDIENIPVQPGVPKALPRIGAMDGRGRE